MTDNHHRGLTDAEVAQSRSIHGANVLTPPKREPLWKLFLQKFNDPIIRILLAAAALSITIAAVRHIQTGEKDYAETLGIFCAVILATCISFWFERDAGKKFDILNTINDTAPVKVIRNGNVCQTPKCDVVVGDIALLETGDEVPADGELLEAIALQIDESCLTGEPVAAKTTAAEQFRPEATYPSNWAMRGSKVLDGHGVLLVKKVGDATEYGRVAADSAEETHQQSPLGAQLERLAKVIGGAGIVVAALIFVVLVAKDLLWYNAFAQQTWIETAQRLLHYLMISVALIVVTVPEGLPMSITLSLALSMRKMLRDNNLVRKIYACETMGAVTVICTDKTGTLTQNQMRVQSVEYAASGDAASDADGLDSFLAESIAINSTAHLDFSNADKTGVIGNPTEGALLLWLHGRGCDYAHLRSASKTLQQMTFSPERKFMATLAFSPILQKNVIYLKGAPEVVLSKCSAVWNAPSQDIADYRPKIEDKLLRFQQQAMRTIAFACKIVSSQDENDLPALLDGGFCFMAAAAIADPVRPDVAAAITRCLNAGVNIKIVTGDTSATAMEIARQIGVWQPSDTDERIITGGDFAALPDEQASERIGGLKIMSRARPSDKRRLVQLLQQKGEVVAVTGDGTNDAPALNCAQVGLSMGSGTSVAKEASDITLLDDSFSSICTAVMWGRSVYQNIQRFIVFQLTVNLTAMVVVFLGTLLDFEMPLTITQMLWVNLIMDTFAAGALASLPPSAGVMNVPPRKNADFIITPAMRCSIVCTGMVFVAVLTALLCVFNNLQMVPHCFTAIPPEQRLIYAQTYFFTLFVMLQFWNLFNVKAFFTNNSAFSSLKKSYGLLIVAGVIIAGQWFIVECGGGVFRTVALRWHDWLQIAALSSLILWTGEALRWRRRRQTLKL